MPDEPRIPHNISVTKGDIHSMKPRPKMKDKVVVRLHEWKDPKRLPVVLLLKFLESPTLRGGVSWNS